MEGEICVTGSIIDEIHSSDILGDQMEGESGVIQSITDELHSRDIQGDQIEGENIVLLEVSLMNFVLGIFKETKWKVKVVLLEE